MRNRRLETKQRMAAIEAAMLSWGQPFSIWTVIWRVTHVSGADTHSDQYRPFLHTLNAMVEDGRLRKITTHNNDSIFWFAHQMIAEIQYQNVKDHLNDDIPF
jgi:hypothetical protein